MLTCLRVGALWERRRQTTSGRSYSSPLAGLFPGWRAGYVMARLGDNLLTRIPLLQLAGSNFELVASLPRPAVNV